VLAKLLRSLARKGGSFNTLRAVRNALKVPQKSKTKETGSSIAAVVSVREKHLIRAVCDRRGEDLSSFLRRSLKQELARLGYLGPEGIRALGLVKEARTPVQQVSDVR